MELYPLLSHPKMPSSPQDSGYLVYWNIIRACMHTLGFFLSELMIPWEQVSEVAGVWTVSHITAAE